MDDCLQTTQNHPFSTKTKHFKCFVTNFLKTVKKEVTDLVPTEEIISCCTKVTYLLTVRFPRGCSN